MAPLPTFADGRKVRAKQREDCPVALLEATAARVALEEEPADDILWSRQPDLHLKLDSPRTQEFVVERVASELGAREEVAGLQRQVRCAYSGVHERPF